MRHFCPKRQWSKAPLSTLTLSFLRQKARVQMNRTFNYEEQI